MKANDNELYRIGLPGRLVQLIREKLGKTPSSNQLSRNSKLHCNISNIRNSTGNSPSNTGQYPQQYGQYQQQPQPGYNQQQPQNPKNPQQPKQAGYPQQQGGLGQQPQYGQQQPIKQPTMGQGQSRIEILLTQLRKRLSN
jgi:hypothetical protein